MDDSDKANQGSWSAEFGYSQHHVSWNHYGSC